MKRYKMIGSGGTGTHLLAPLLAYLQNKHGENWEMVIIDGDSVEVHNLERQLFHPAMVTMNKAEAAILPYKHLKNLSAMPIFVGAANIADVIQDGDTVLICVDNFPVRSTIESYCNTLPNVVVINGGNEKDTGSCQIWERKGGKNTTPALSYNHPEINKPGLDRSVMTCEEAAKIPGGEQLIVTNMMSANYMLLAIMNVEKGEINWTELQFDLTVSKSYPIDYRENEGWQTV